MPAISLFLDGDNCWPDLKKKTVEESHRPIGMALLKGGMASGKPSVTIRIDLDDKRVVLVQTSLELLSSSVRAIVARTEAFP